MQASDERPGVEFAICGEIGGHPSPTVQEPTRCEDTSSSLGVGFLLIGRQCATPRAARLSDLASVTWKDHFLQLSSREDASWAAQRE